MTDQPAPDILANGSKATDPAKLSAQSRADNSSFAPTSDVTGAGGLFWIQMGAAHDEEPAWNAIYPHYRDLYLQRFSRSEPMLASAVYSMATRIGTLNYEVNGPPRAKKFASELLERPGLGDTLKDVVQKLSIDLDTSDNGAFLELWRAGNPLSDAKDRPVLGFAHLDSRQCLGRDTRVLLSNGTRRRIVDIVRNKEAVEVMAVDKTGNLVPAKVTGWHETPLGDRYWMRLVLDNPARAYGRKQGLWLTNDHQVMTLNGWKTADSLVKQDRVVTQYDDLTDKQAEMLCGTLLGDGWLTYSSGSIDTTYGIGFVHCIEQREWLDLKRRGLRGWNLAPVYRNRNTYVSETAKTPALIEWRDAWYPNGKKVIARGFVEDHFSDLMMATWFLDDGHISFPNRLNPAAVITANGLNRDDIEWASQLLKDNGIYNTIVVKRPNQWDLHIGARHGNALRFFERIAPYVPPSMRYKLPIRDDMPSFNPKLWDLGHAPRYADGISIIEKGDYAKQTATFCLDVEEHQNFIAAGAVVHNCWRSFDPEFPVWYTNPVTHAIRKLHRSRVVFTANNPQPNELARGIGFCATSRVLRMTRVFKNMQIYLDEKVGGRFNRAIGSVSGVTPKQLKDALVQNDSVTDAKGFVIYKDIPFLVSPSMEKGSEIKIMLQDLASIPDGFVFRDDADLYAYILSFAFGVDAREFWPATSSGATKADATVQNMKARGRGIGDRIETVEGLIRAALPETVTMEYDFSDDEQDKATADIHKLQADTFKVFFDMGAINAQQVAALAIAKGILDGDILSMNSQPLTSDDNPGTPQDGAGATENDTGVSNDNSAGEDNQTVKTMGDYGRSIRNLARGYWLGDLSRFDFVDGMVSAINRNFEQAWEQVEKQYNITPDERTKASQERLDLAINTEISYLSGFADYIEANSKANGGLFESVLNRCDMWESGYERVMTLAQTVVGSDRKFRWVRNELKDSCADCIQYDGLVFFGSQWEAAGVRPKMWELACRGVFCGCELEETALPKTRGEVPPLIGHKHLDSEVAHA